MTSSPRGKSESPRPRKRSRSMARNGASEGSPRTRAEILAGQVPDAQRSPETSSSSHRPTGNRPTLEEALRTVEQQKTAIEGLEGIVSLSRIQLARLCAGGEFADEVNGLLKGRDTSRGAARTYAEAKEFLGELLDFEGLLKPREATMAERLIRGENLRSLMPEANGRGPEREP